MALERESFTPLPIPPLDVAYLEARDKFNERVLHWVGGCTGWLPNKRCPFTKKDSDA